MDYLTKIFSLCRRLSEAWGLDLGRVSVSVPGIKQKVCNTRSWSQAKEEDHHCQRWRGAARSMWLWFQLRLQWTS